jgi:NAD(P)-dependent dehydrogenase (short-subunit alcohol dehydrogenase family)
MSILLITGSTGIAAATASLAAKRGHSIFIAGIEEGSCRRLASQLPAADWASGDLREESFADRVLSQCLDRYGRVDSLFNVAGISGRKFGDGPLHECSAEGWDTTMKSNVRSMFLMSRTVLRHWLDTRQKGSILNMTSVLAAFPEPQHFATHAYAASKGAITALTRSMAAYYATHGIRVNAIAPGLVRTPMSARAQQDETILRFIAQKQPLSSGMLDPTDVAEAALFLMTEASHHITGEVLTVDGGWTVT